MGTYKYDLKSQNRNLVVLDETSSVKEDLALVLNYVLLKINSFKVTKHYLGNMKHNDLKQKTFLRVTYIHYKEYVPIKNDKSLV